MINKKQNTLKLILEFKKKFNKSLWLEGGSALGAVREGKLLEWDHDIDIGLWYDDIINKIEILDFFKNYNFNIIIQKNFVFIDNIIQLKSKNRENYLDIDLYLYKKKQNFALMRWINSPVGAFSKQSLYLLRLFNTILLSKKNKFFILRKIFTYKLVNFLFRNYLYLYINFYKCRYHKFPKTLFNNFIKIKVENVEFFVPKEYSLFLEYRYGKNWMIKDKNFNEQGKWKMSKARELLPMNNLPMPKML